MVEIELKPCPFCGGEAELKKDHSCADMQFDDDKDYAWVECKECHAQGKVYSVVNARYKEEKVCIELLNSIVVNATDAWNRRTY